MKEFPKHANVENKKNFHNIYFVRNLAYLRLDIYEHMLLDEENNYFDLEKWTNKKLNKNKEMMEKMSAIIIKELQILGWKCKTSFGGTGLFIYSTDKPPPSCYEDGF